MSKPELRESVKAWRRERTQEEISSWSRMIAGRLVQRPQWRDSESVALYVSLPGEVQTGALLDVAWRAGKTVYLPAVLPGENVLRLGQVMEKRELQAGNWGIPEPPRESLLDGLPELDLVVLPGLAFDRQGHRLGYGRGFYDRLLARIAPTVWTVGLVFDAQLLPHVPFDPWDVPVRFVLTEKNWLDCREPV